MKAAALENPHQPSCYLRELMGNGGRAKDTAKLLIDAALAAGPTDSLVVLLVHVNELR